MIRCIRLDNVSTETEESNGTIEPNEETLYSYKIVNYQGRGFAAAVYAGDKIVLRISKFKECKIQRFAQDLDRPFWRTKNSR